MFTDPSVVTGAVRLDGDIFSGHVRVTRWPGAVVSEVVTAHHSGEAVVVGQGEGHSSLVFCTVL